MGTLFTACGMLTTSWIKLWHLPFSGSIGPVCATCKVVVERKIEDLGRGRASSALGPGLLEGFIGPGPGNQVDTTST